MGGEIRCGPGSAQTEWLKENLAANSDEGQCTLAYKHHPRFSSGVKHGGTSTMEPLWEALYEAGAEVADWVRKTLGWSVDLVERPRKPAPEEVL